MRRTMVVISALIVLAAAAANAQQGAQQTAPANVPYVAPTGKTVPRPADLPNPGSVARDPKDRSDEERKVDGITGGICKGC